MYTSEDLYKHVGSIRTTPFQSQIRFLSVTSRHVERACPALQKLSDVGHIFLDMVT